MYIVKLRNVNKNTEIHGIKEKLKSGSVVKGINTIDSFSFSVLPSNAGFNAINDLQTLVDVYNTNKNRYEFQGRILYSSSSMDETGFISKEVICESYLGFLCDSQQKYVATQNWTVTGFFSYVVNVHNSQVEEYKRFTIGEVTVTDPNDNLFVGIQRENSWQTIKSKLIDKLGGEITFRVVDGVTYLDYVEKRGATLSTEIALSRNMKAITREDDPTAYISRLIPLGAKLKDSEGNDTEVRLDITSVNGGVDYIESEEALRTFGIRYETVIFEEVTVASNLLAKAKTYLAENNKVQVKYSISALDLSLLGLDINDFDVCNYYPIKNALLGIDDIARIIKKTVDVVNECQSSFEVGDNFKTLSDIQLEREKTALETAQKLESAKNDLKAFVKNRVANTYSELQKIVEEQHENVIELDENVTVLTRNVKTMQEQVTGIVDSLDNEWIELELDESFVAYEKENQPMYKAMRNVVEIKGCVCPVEEVVSSGEKVIFASGIPEELCPSSVRSFICQGSGMNRWMLTVETDGTLTISKYGVTECVAVPTTEVLTFNGTYMVEQKESDES